MCRPGSDDARGQRDHRLRSRRPAVRLGALLRHDRRYELVAGDHQANDRLILDSLLAGNGRAIYENAARTQDRYKVCGLPALVLLAELMTGKKAILLDYEVYRESATSSAVTYASAVFTD